MTQSINECDIDLRKGLCSNIIISGGNTKLFKFPERILAELKQNISKDLKVI